MLLLCIRLIHNIHVQQTHLFLVCRNSSGFFCVSSTLLFFRVALNCISFVQLLFLTATVGVDHQLPHNIFRCDAKVFFFLLLLFLDCF